MPAHEALSRLTLLVALHAGTPGQDSKRRCCRDRLLDLMLEASEEYCSAVMKLARFVLLAENDPVPLLLRLVEGGI